LSIIASLTGVAAGFATWGLSSYLVSLFIYWGATRSTPMSDKTLKAYEIILCGLTIAASLVVFILVARALWPPRS
jgi:hypothetical protein